MPKSWEEKTEEERQADLMKIYRRRPELMPKPEPGVGSLMLDELGQRRAYGLREKFLTPQEAIRRQAERVGKVGRGILNFPQAEADIAYNVLGRPIEAGLKGKQLPAEPVGGGTPQAPTQPRVMPAPVQAPPAERFQYDRTPQQDRYGQGRVFNPITNQYQNAPTTSVGISAMLPGTFVGDRGIYRAAPAATNWEDYAKQRAATNALMQTGIGSTREAQQRILRQGQLDQLQREGMAYRLKGQQVIAGATQGQSQAEQVANQLKVHQATLTDMINKGADPEAIRTEQNAIRELEQRGTGQAGGQQTEGESARATGTNLGEQLGQGVATSDADEVAWDRVVSALEGVGYDRGRLPPRLQAWITRMEQKYGTKLKLPTQPKVV